MEKPQYEVRYKVSITKKSLRDGQKLGISDDAKNSIIQDMKLLKFWPDTNSIFDYEKVNGALKFNFDYVEGKWIRVFVFQDDVRKIMWVFKVIAKKTNKLTQTDLASVDSFVREMELDIKSYEKEMKQQLMQLKVVKGGKDE